MLRVKEKEITTIYAPKPIDNGFEAKSINVVYRYGKIIWQAISSCFGKGYWINDKPWVNTDGWKNE